MSAATPTVAWNNPTWVLAIMLHPRETELLEHIAKGKDTLLLDRKHWLADNETAVRRAVTAGDALALLYAMDQAPWISHVEPSVDKAIALVRSTGVHPKSTREIQNRISEFRSVWHLWAAWRLIRERYPESETDLPADLLRTARAVQDFALAWRPKRGNTNAALLDPASAYLVPDAIAPCAPEWGEPAHWINRALKNYRPRSR